MLSEMDWMQSSGAFCRNELNTKENLSQETSSENILLHVSSLGRAAIFKYIYIFLHARARQTSVYYVAARQAGTLVFNQH